MTITLKAKTSRRELDLINVASRHLNTMGVSLEWFGEIAKELGISRPALYNYVVDRDDLLLKCYVRSCERYETALKKASESEDDPVANLGHFLGELCRPGDPEIAVLSEIDALSPDKQQIVRDRREAIVGQLAEIIRRGRTLGVFRPVDDRIVANAVLGLASWPPLYGRWASGAGFAEVAEATKDILFFGLAQDRQNLDHKPVRMEAPSSALIDPFDRRALEDAKRTAIVIAASYLFNTRGLGATRVEDVGAAVGLSKRAIYHHFGDKDSLIEACIDRAIRFYLEILDAAQNAPATRLEAYHGAVSAIVETFHDRRRTVLAPYVGSGLLGPESRRAMIGFAERLTEGYRRLLVEGEGEGSVRTLRLDAVLASLPGVFSWAANSAPIAGADASRTADEIATLATRGIMA